MRLVLVRRVFTSTISNRAVKPRTADGTAFTGGRVGRCHLLTRMQKAVAQSSDGFLHSCQQADTSLGEEVVANR